MPEQKFEIVAAMIEHAQARGAAAIDLKALGDAVADIRARPVAPDMSPAELERLKAHYAQHLVGVSHLHASALEFVKQVFPFAHEAIRTAFLANAGAAVALLAFLGTTAGKASSAQVAAVAGGMPWYIGGAVLAAVCFGIAYVAQSRFAADPNHAGWGVGAKLVACVSYVGSIGAFAIGGCVALQGFLP